MDNILLSAVELKCNDSQNYQLLDKFRVSYEVLKQSCALAEKHYSCFICLCIFMQVIYMGVVLYAPALALNAGI